MTDFVKELIPLAEIRRDGGTQSRAELSQATINEYSERYDSGDALPPVVVFYDGTSYWLADGFHRVGGAEASGMDALPAEVHQGTQRDAVLYSVGANSKHGLPRTNADKRRAVELLLRDEEWAQRSDRWIAEKCHVHPDTVGVHRRQLSDSDSSPRLGQDGKTRKLPERKRTAPDRPRSDMPDGAMPPLNPPWVCESCGQENPFSTKECECESEPSAQADDPELALLNLDEDIERHMLAWKWGPARFIAALEAAARRARDHFEVKEAANG